MNFKWAGITLAMLAIVGAWAAPKETKAQRDKRMEWWREARFGMFIHWGLYSVPAGEWGGKTGYGEWIREEAHIPVNIYEQFQPKFNPVKFDADKWVKMAHDAGMKYVVITTKHHDGFNLFDSPYTDWDIMGTPFKRDIMKEMAAACHKYGLKMCWYHSIMDWHHPDYLPRRSWETNIRPVDGANMDRYVKYLRNEVGHLLTHYGPIGVMWFDGEWESTWNDAYGKPLYDLCRKLQPNVIVNNRVGVSRGGSTAGDGGPEQVGDFSTPEQYIPPTGLPGVDWETCMTMNDHWGFNSHDQDWKSAPQLIRNLVDVASKGGNYLLNIGPRSDGTFPPEAVARLHDISQWMGRYGTTIHDTTASVFDKLPWGRSTTRRSPTGTTLFLHVFDWPKDGRLVVPGIGNRPLGASLVCCGSLKVARAGSDLVVSVSRSAPNAICSTVALKLSGAPVVYRAPMIDAPTQILVDGLDVRIDSGSKELETRYTLTGQDPTTASPLYRQPVRLAKTTTVKAASFHHGKRVSSVTSATFTQVKPLPADQLRGLEPGLSLQTYAGDWDKVPDFGTLSPTASSVVNSIQLIVGTKRMEHVGRRYSGYIAAPADGVYNFALTSDDGSRLWIDDQLVVDNDGLHSTETKTGQIALAKGNHKILVGWFNKTGGSALILDWAKIGQKLKPIDSNAMHHAGGEG